MAKVILVVDDSATLRASAEYVLRAAGYRVIVAEDGMDGLKKLDELSRKNETVNMIITDVNMPNMDGIQFTRMVKSGPHSKAPVLILTTESQASKKMEGKAAGAAGWLVKPFEPDQLVTVVKKLAL